MDQDDRHRKAEGWDPLHHIEKTRYKARERDYVKPPPISAAKQSSLDPLGAGYPPSADHTRYQQSTFAPQSSPLIPDPGLPFDQQFSSHQSAHSFGSPLWPSNQGPVEGGILDQPPSYPPTQRCTDSQQSGPALSWQPGSDSFGVVENGPFSQYYQNPQSTTSQPSSNLDPGQSVAVRTVPLPQTPVHHADETTQIEQSRLNEAFRQRPHYIDSLTGFDANAGSSYFLDRSENGSPPIIAIDPSVETMPDGRLVVRFGTWCLHPYRGNSSTWAKVSREGKSCRQSGKARAQCRQVEEEAESALPSLAKLSEMWRRAWQSAVIDKRLSTTEDRTDVWEQATDNFEGCLGYYLNPGTLSGNESAAATIRRSRLDTFNKLQSSELLDPKRRLMPPSRLTRKESEDLMSIPLDPNITAPSVIFGSEQLPSGR